MYREIHKLEKTIRKILDNGTELQEDFVQAANLYRDAAYIVNRSKQIRDSIFPDIKEKFEQVFEEEDKIHTRALQVGEALVSIGKDSERATTDIDPDALLTALKNFLPEYVDIIEKAYENNMQLARISTKPTLYVLDKEHSSPEVMKQFTEAFKNFQKSPSVATLNEARGFSWAEMKAKGSDVINTALRKLEPFFNKMLRTNKALSKKADNLYNSTIAQFMTTTVTEATTDDSPEHPHVSRIKRLSNKAIATVDESSDFGKEIVQLAKDYEGLNSIIKRAEDLKSDIASDLKGEMVELFDEQERAYNSVIDLGNVIVALTKEGGTRSGAVDKVLAGFITELKSLIPEHEELIENIYEMNKVVNKVSVKPRITTKGITEGAIDKMAKWVEAIQRFVTKMVSRLKPKTRKLSQKIRNISDRIAKIDSMVTETVFKEDIANPTHFCVYQPGMAIFGVGKTKKEAWDDAKEWADNTGKDWKKSFKVAPCTKDLYDYVKDKGTPDTWDETNGVQHL